MIIRTTFVSLVMGLFLTCAAGAAPLGFWVTSPLHNVFKDTPAPVHRLAEIRLIAARNQTEDSQVVLMPTEELKGARVEFEPLVSRTGAELAPERFDFHFIEFIRVEKNSTQTPAELLLRPAPDDFPDGFLEERTLDIAPGRNWPVYLSFRVPRDAEPGVYTGKLWLVGGDQRAAVPVSLEVVPVTLPENTRLAITNWIDYGAIAKHFDAPLWGEKFWSALKGMARMMHAHHQNIAMVAKETMKITKEPDGKLTFDFTIFDRWVETFDSEGVGKFIEISHTGGRVESTGEAQFAEGPMQAYERGTDKSSPVLIEGWLPPLYKHLQEKGWEDRTLIHIADEPCAANAGTWKALSKRVHAAAPKLKRIDALWTSDVFDEIEIGVPILHTYGPMQQAAREKHVTLWFYTAWIPQENFPNRLMDYPAIKTRLLHWINYRYDLPGYLHWALCWWDVPFLQFAPGDCEIVWPGKNGARSSLRYEAMRSGIEDYELMAMLEDATRRVAAKLDPKWDPKTRSMELCKRILRESTDYDISSAKLQAVREQLLRELPGIEKPPLLLVKTDPSDGSKGGKVLLTGVVEPGVGVTLNGKPLKVDATGHFEATSGEKELVIVAEKDGARKSVVREFR